jgi:S1-C subfamily serine protease
MGYAIPSNVVKYVSDNILYYCDGKAPENPYRCMLGITVYGMKYYTVYDQTTGKLLKREIVQIQSLTNTSIAKGKLEVGDIIQYIKIHGKTYEVHRMHNVVDIMLNARVGDTVILGIVRGDKEMAVEIEITQAALTIWK